MVTSAGNLQSEAADAQPVAHEIQAPVGLMLRTPTYVDVISLKTIKTKSQTILRPCEGTTED